VEMCDGCLNLTKTSTMKVLVQCLATEWDPPGNRDKDSGLLERLRLAMRVVLPCGICSVDGSKVLRA